MGIHKLERASVGKKVAEVSGKHLYTDWKEVERFNLENGRKGQSTRSPLEPQAATRPCQHFDFSPVEPVSGL